MLPMADRSAAVLVDVILSDGPEATDSLAEQLAVDPPLLLWTVCVAARRDDFRPRSVREPIAP